MSTWEKKISMPTRLRVGCRNFIIKNIHTPLSNARRRSGLADRDIFKHILIQTNYKCTRKCYFCHYGLETPPENLNMPEKLFSDIIDQLHRINYKKRIGLFEMNEPLTDKRIFDFIAYTRKKLPHAWIFISSNGDLLNLEKLDRLFRAGLNYIYLSSYDQAALSRNTRLLEALNKNDRGRINHLNRTYQKNWQSRGGHIEQFKTKTVYKPCDRPFEVMYIKPSGTVHACYNDFFDDCVMGDLNEASLLDVWFGKKFNSLRKSLITGNRQSNVLCSNCDYIGYGNLPAIPLSWRIKSIMHRQRRLQ